MGEFFPAQVFKQLSHARAVIERHLAATLDTIHLFGSAIDGGLKPDSDIDLLVTVSAAPNDSLRQALMLDLLKVSSRHCCKVSDEAAFCLIQRPYISKTLLT
ncbi:nucleotidyltransferase domain-containing protein, partial [Escherichia coli]